MPLSFSFGAFSWRLIKFMRPNKSHNTAVKLHGSGPKESKKNNENVRWKKPRSSCLFHDAIFPILCFSKLETVKIKRKKWKSLDTDLLLCSILFLSQKFCFERCSSFKLVLCFPFKWLLTVFVDLFGSLILFRFTPKWYRGHRPTDTLEYAYVTMYFLPFCGKFFIIASLHYFSMAS